MIAQYDTPLFQNANILKKLIPSLVLVLISLVGAGAFYACEKDKTLPRNDTCNFAVTYWNSLFFVNTVHNTIGYGTVFPCSNAGRVVTIIYSLIGLPTFLIALDNLGEIIMLLITGAWNGWKRLKNACLPKHKRKAFVTHSHTMPMLLAFSIAGSWILASAAYFYYFEERKSYFEWIYFVYISVATIGFGDIAPEKYNYTAFHFVFITIGLSLFSMILNIVQTKLGDLSDIVAESIAKDYQDTLAEATAGMAHDPEKAKRIISEKLRSQKGGFFLEKLMGTKAKENLLNQYTQFANMSNVATQTERFVSDFQVMCVLSAGDSKSVQTTKVIGAAMEGRTGWNIARDTIGIGTFGKVKSARHEKTGELVAVKILSRQKIKHLDVVAKIRQEIEHQQMLNHPHVIRMYEVISSSTDIFMFMEYVPGGELFDYIVKHGLLCEPEARRIFQQLISAVAYLHRHRVVHRDLKPENILLDANRSVKLADFGLSHFIADGELLKTSCGSANYAAPEVITGGWYGPEVDIWSCGVILYALLTGSLPFDDANTSVLFKKIQAGHFFVPDFLSEPAVDLIRHMLVTDPLERATMWQIVQHPWFKMDLPDHLFPWSSQLNAPDSSVCVMAVEATAEELGIDECDVLHALHHHSDLDMLVAAEYDLIVRQLRDQEISNGELKNANRTPTRKYSQLAFSNEVARFQWHLGIRSTGRPDEIMTEVYKAMKRLDFEWRIINPYKVFVRKRNGKFGEKLPLITLQLYCLPRHKTKLYLLDFMMNEGCASSASFDSDCMSSDTYSRERSRATSFSKAMEFLHADAVPPVATCCHSRRMSAATVLPNRPRVYSAGAVSLRRPLLVRRRSNCSSGTPTSRHDSEGDYILSKLQVRSIADKRDDTGLGSSIADSFEDLEEEEPEIESTTASQTMVFYDMCASLIAQLAETDK